MLHHVRTVNAWKVYQLLSITNLNASFGQPSLLGQFFTRVNIRVLGSFKGPFQFFQLLGTERRPGSALLAFQRNTRLRFNV